MPQTIAFYAPLKPPDHPVPSGDRTMARLLMAALSGTGRDTVLASTLRSFLPDPDDSAEQARIADGAAAEIDRIDREWRAATVPALWFTYHPYYKAPDLIGPTLCRQFGIPYVTAECSLSPRRDIGHWTTSQARVAQGVRQAALNICLTARDLQGLHEVAPRARSARLAPFIDAAPFLSLDTVPERNRLITVAMMRAGDKARSYAMLARALNLLDGQPFTLTVIGDGPERAATEALFAPFAPRVTFTGLLPPDAIARHLSHAALFVWPGCGEAYGLSYLEAQAAGVPVVAQRTAGVPEVVADGKTGCLTPPGDTEAFATAIRRMLTDDSAREAAGAQARRHVTGSHDLTAATAQLRDLLGPLVLAP